MEYHPHQGRKKRPVSPPQRLEPPPDLLDPPPERLQIPLREGLVLAHRLLQLLKHGFRLGDTVLQASDLALDGRESGTELRGGGVEIAQGARGEGASARVTAAQKVMDVPQSGEEMR